VQKRLVEIYEKRWCTAELGPVPMFLSISTTSCVTRIVQERLVELEE